MPDELAPATPHIRLATAAGASRALSTLTRAFAGYPWTRHTLAAGDHERRPATFHELFSLGGQGSPHPAPAAPRPPAGRTRPLRRPAGTDRCGPSGRDRRTPQASSSSSAVTADSVSGTPSSFARRSAIDSKRRIRPATASLVMGGSAS